MRTPFYLLAISWLFSIAFKQAFSLLVQKKSRITWPGSCFRVSFSARGLSSEVHWISCIFWYNLIPGFEGAFYQVDKSCCTEARRSSLVSDISSGCWVSFLSNSSPSLSCGILSGVFVRYSLACSLTFSTSRTRSSEDLTMVSFYTGSTCIGSYFSSVMLFSEVSFSMMGAFTEFWATGTMFLSYFVLVFCWTFSEISSSFYMNSFVFSGVSGVFYFSVSTF